MDRHNGPNQTYNTTVRFDQNNNRIITFTFVTRNNSIRTIYTNQRVEDIRGRLISETQTQNVTYLN